MKLITERGLIHDVATRWYAQYQSMFVQHPDKKETYEKLLALDTETATSADVSNIIGNYSWTTQYCNECGEKSRFIVEIGEEPGYDSSTAQICPYCIQKAWALVQGEHS